MKIFANETEQLTLTAPGIYLANVSALTDAAEQGNWLRLATFGEHGHRMGLQVVDREAADKMAANFAGFINKLGRMARGEHGVPVYVGHPDDPAFANQPGHQDSRAHAWITAVEARDDGIYVKAKWGKTGAEMLANAHYKYLSPRWAMEKVAGNKFRPVRLVSVGLTNTPNIPGDAIANEKPTDTMKDKLIQILAALGFSNEAATAFADETEGAPALEEVTAKVADVMGLPDQLQAANATAEALTAERDAEKTRAEEAAEKLTAAEQELSAANQQLTAHALDAAVSAGRITGAERKGWEQRFATDFPAANAALSEIEAGSALKTGGKTADLGARRGEIIEANEARELFRAKVDEIMANAKVSFDRAYTTAKTKHADLYKRAYPTA